MAKTIHCIVVTPEATAFEVDAEFVALPLFDGEIGIAVDHSPMIGRLGYGEMRIKADGKTSVYYLDSGFVQVAANTVSVLTNRAVPAAKLESAKAEALLAAASKKPATSPELEEIRDRAVSQARAQVRVARKG